MAKPAPVEPQAQQLADLLDERIRVAPTNAACAPLCPASRRGAAPGKAPPPRPSKIVFGRHARGLGRGADVHGVVVQPVLLRPLWCGGVAARWAQRCPARIGRGPPASAWTARVAHHTHTAERHRRPQSSGSTSRTRPAGCRPRYEGRNKPRWMVALVRRDTSSASATRRGSPRRQGDPGRFHGNVGAGGHGDPHIPPPGRARR